MLSPYGEQLLFVTEHIASTGEVDGKEMSNAMMKWCSTEYTGRKDHALKTFEENMSNGKTYPDCGADDNQGKLFPASTLSIAILSFSFAISFRCRLLTAHCYMKVVPVTCLYAGKPELKEKVEEAIRVHQNNDVAVAFGVAAAIILERVLLGKGMPDDDLVETFDSSPRDSWREAAKFEDLETLLLELSHELMKGKEDSPFYDLAARSCTLPGSFTAPAFLIQREAEKDDAYVTALRSNILGAGDTCSRAVFIGAVLAAADDRCVPQDWVDKMDQETLNRIDAAAAKIADLVSAS